MEKPLSSPSSPIKIPYGQDEKPVEAVGVVLVSPRYPLSQDNPDSKVGLEEGVFLGEPDVSVLMSSAVYQDGFWYPGSGRITTVVARGDSIAEARKKAYLVADKIKSIWIHVEFRSDIALDSAAMM